MSREVDQERCDAFCEDCKPRRRGKPEQRICSAIIVETSEDDFETTDEEPRKEVGKSGAQGVKKSNNQSDEHLKRNATTYISDPRLDNIDHVRSPGEKAQVVVDERDSSRRPRDRTKKPSVVQWRSPHAQRRNRKSSIVWAEVQSSAGRSSTNKEKTEKWKRVQETETKEAKEVDYEVLT